MPDQPDITAPVDTPTTTEPVSRRDGSTLVWAVQQPDSFSDLDPVQALDFGTYAILSQTLEYLTTIGNDGQPRPALATSWSPSQGGTVWTIELRPDVTFHDGDPFTAADVVWSLDRVASEAFSGLATVLSPGNVVAVDDLTVEITLDQPTIEFPFLVSDAAPQAAIVRDGDIPSSNSVIGTGPFRMIDYDENTGVIYEANSDWWLATPTVDTLEFVFFASAGAGATALQTGQVDGLQILDSTQLAGIGDNADFSVRSSPARNHRQIWLRTDSGTFADVRVREAFALSIDRQALADEFYGPYARVANDHPFLPDSPGFDASAPQRTKDDDAARALLAEAGFPDGVSVTMEVGDLSEIPALASAIARQAESAGFDITVNVTPNSSFYGDAWCPGPATADTPCGDNGEIGIVDYGHRPANAIFLQNPLTSEGPWNASNFTDPDFDELVDRYTSAADVDAASAILIEIQQQLREQVPIVIPFFFDLVYGHRSDITTVNVTALGQPRLALAEFS